MPDPLADQWERAPALYEALGWTVDARRRSRPTTCWAPTRRRRPRPAARALILTGDRDMFQCAGTRVRPAPARTPGGAGRDRRRRGRERYGVAAGAVPDFIALRGDPSDGLPGAKGIGEKTAAELLKRHGTLEAAIAGAVREKPSVRARADRAGGRAARVPRDRDAAGRRRRAAAGPRHRPRGRRRGGARRSG